MTNKVLVVQCKTYDKTSWDVQRELNLRLNDSAQAYLITLNRLIGLNPRSCIEKLLGIDLYYPHNFITEIDLDKMETDIEGVMSGKYRIPICDKLIGIKSDTRCLKEHSNCLRDPNLGQGAYEIARRNLKPAILLPEYDLEKITRFCLE